MLPEQRKTYPAGQRLHCCASAHVQSSKGRCTALQRELCTQPGGEKGNCTTCSFGLWDFWCMGKLWWYQVRDIKNLEKTFYESRNILAATNGWKGCKSEEREFIQVPHFVLVVPVLIANSSKRVTKEGCISPTCSPEVRTNL